MREEASVITGNDTEGACADQSASLSDLERLWGGAGPIDSADPAMRDRFLAIGCPLPPPPPPPPAAERIWYRPLCA
jgi:hypothetical protein